MTFLQYVVLPLDIVRRSIRHSELHVLPHEGHFFVVTSAKRPPKRYANSSAGN